MSRSTRIGIAIAGIVFGALAIYIGLGFGFNAITGLFYQEGRRQGGDYWTVDRYLRYHTQDIFLSLLVPIGWFAYVKCNRYYQSIRWPEE